MSLTIELPEDVEIALKADGSEIVEDRLWWEQLSPERKAEELAALKRALDAIDKGQTSSAEDVFRRVRAKVAQARLTQ